MGNQGQADQFCKIDRLNDVGGGERDVIWLAANGSGDDAYAWSNGAALSHKLYKWGPGANSPWIPLMRPISGP
jgi:hypothetical protein